jgi:transposase
MSHVRNPDRAYRLGHDTAWDTTPPAGPRARIRIATRVSDSLHERVRIDRLVAAGKPKKVAIVASMRKLLTVLNAMVRSSASWDESIHRT